MGQQTYFLISEVLPVLWLQHLPLLMIESGWNNSQSLPGSSQSMHQVIK